MRRLFLLFIQKWRISFVYIHEFERMGLSNAGEYGIMIMKKTPKRCFGAIGPLQMRGNRFAWQSSLAVQLGKNRSAEGTEHRIPMRFFVEFWGRGCRMREEIIIKKGV